MATNDKHTEVVNQVFKGNLGSESAFFREMFEILLLERETTEENPINEVQQATIDKRIAQGKIVNKMICNTLGCQTLEEMKPEEVIEE